MAGPIRFQANQDGEILLNLNRNGRKPAEVAALRALKPALFREWHNYRRCRGYPHTAFFLQMASEEDGAMLKALYKDASLQNDRAYIKLLRKGQSLNGQDLINCPYCGRPSINQVDHHLPEALFPMLALAPANLVPCCGTCNGKKSQKGLTVWNQARVQPREVEASIAGADRFLHPYYDTALVGLELYLQITFVPTVTFHLDVAAAAPPALAKMVRWQLAELEVDQELVATMRVYWRAMVNHATLLRGSFAARRDRVLERARLQHKSAIEHSTSPNAWAIVLYRSICTTDSYLDYLAHLGQP